LEIHGVKAFGEPAIDRRQQLTGSVAFALPLSQTAQAQRRPQLPGFRLLTQEGRQSIKAAKVLR
jgi:hypothetical protein